MSKRRAPQPPLRPSGPPPLRSDGSKPAPRRKRRSGLREIIRAFRRRPTIYTIREELGHVLIWGLYAFVFIFLVGGIYSFGGAQRRDTQETEERKVVDVIAQVGSDKLTSQHWQELITYAGLDDPQYLSMRHQQLGQMAEEWIRDEVQLQLAHQRHLKVSKADIEKELDKRVKEQMKAQRGDKTERQWELELEKRDSSAEKIAGELRKKAVENGGDGLSRSLLLDKVKKSIEADIKLEDKDYKEAYEETEGRVFLLRSPSTKPAPPGENQKETPEQAKQRQDNEDAWRKGLDAKKADAEKILAEIQADPTKFADVAKAKSDDFTTKTTGGELKSFNRDQARFGDAFKKAAFEVEPGKVSDLIEGNEGWVIYQCTSRKVWPDDFRKADPRTFDEAQKLADEVRAQLTAGADFETLAKKSSEDEGSAKKGGDLGWVERGQMVKPFEKVAFALEKGAISQPFRSDYGIHILQVMDRELPTAGEQLPPDEDPTPDPDDKKAVAEAKALKELPLPDKPAAPAKKVLVRHILFKAQDPDKLIEDKKQQLEDRKKSEHFNKVLEDARRKGLENKSIRVFDPQVEAYMADRENKPDEVMADLQEAAEMWPASHADVHLEIAQRYERNAQMGSRGPDAAKAQVAAVEALAKDPEAAPGLLEVLDSPLPEVKKAAAKALGDLKSPDATARLQALVANDPDEGVAEAAKTALGQIGATVPERTVKPAATGLAPGAKPGVTVPPTKGGTVKMSPTPPAQTKSGTVKTEPTPTTPPPAPPK
jgi:parvulin-like peptidyl-prolyl isomerase